MVDQHEGTPVVAGIVTAIVGSSSSFVVVLAGLTAVGASPAQAASGLLTLCVTQALGMLWLAPPAPHPDHARLVDARGGAARLDRRRGGRLAGRGRRLRRHRRADRAHRPGPGAGDLIARIPTSLARAMLAGVLLPICLEPVTGLADSPAYVGPVVLAWLVMHRISRRWAVPVSLAVALVVVVVTAGVRRRVGRPGPVPHLDHPALDASPRS